MNQVTVNVHMNNPEKVGVALYGRDANKASHVFGAIEIGEASIFVSSIEGAHALINAANEIIAHLS